MTSPFEPEEVPRRLLAWYGREGRALPWRQTRDPYRIWLSEIMLQQTTVAAVIPYYERFLARFPNLQSLAAADLDQVLEVWVGLGYYSRARNLHKAARQVVTEYDGVFPQTVDELMTLPGIGRSTAGAICSIAFDRPAPILDGNVRRVLVRLFAWTADPRSREADKQLWAWAEALTPAVQPHDYAQAIMDLGATVCTPKAPQCARCPLADLCQARAGGLVEQLPAKRPKASLPTRRQVALVVRADGQVLVHQRPAEGLLGGLWEFPNCEQTSSRAGHEDALSLCDGLELKGAPVEAGGIRHTYSHFKLELTVFVLDRPTGATVVQSPQSWFPESDLDNLPLHGAHRKAWELVAAAEKLSSA